MTNAGRLLLYSPPAIWRIFCAPCISAHARQLISMSVYFFCHPDPFFSSSPLFLFPFFSFFFFFSFFVRFVFLRCADFSRILLRLSNHMVFLLSDYLRSLLLMTFLGQLTFVTRSLVTCHDFVCFWSSSGSLTFSRHSLFRDSFAQPLTFARHKQQSRLPDHNGTTRPFPCATSALLSGPSTQQLAHPCTTVRTKERVTRVVHLPPYFAFCDSFAA